MPSPSSCSRRAPQPRLAHADLDFVRVCVLGLHLALEEREREVTRLLAQYGETFLASYYQRARVLLAPVDADKPLVTRIARGLVRERLVTILASLGIEGVSTWTSLERAVELASAHVTIDCAIVDLAEYRARRRA